MHTLTTMDRVSLRTGDIIECALPTGFHLRPYHVPVPGSKCARCQNTLIVQGIHMTDDSGIFVVHGCQTCQFRWLLPPGSRVAISPMCQRKPLPPPLPSSVDASDRDDVPEPNCTREAYEAALRSVVANRLASIVDNAAGGERMEAALYARCKGVNREYKEAFKSFVYSRDL